MSNIFKFVSAFLASMAITFVFSGCVKEHHDCCKGGVCHEKCECGCVKGKCCHCKDCPHHHKH